MILNSAMPYFLAAALVVAGLSYVQGRRDGRELATAKDAREREVALIATEAAATAAAEAITRIKVENKTIQQRVEREIQTRVVYRDCGHAPGVRDAINEALTGRPKPAADRGMPAPDAAGR